jgi:ribosomal protein S19
MSRSKFKIPFVHRSLRGYRFLENRDEKKLQHFWKRDSIMNQILDFNDKVKIYNGRAFLSIFLKSELVGYKLGSIAVTRIKASHKGKVKVKKKT